MKELKDIIWAYDDRRNIALPGNEKETLNFAVERWLVIAQKSIEMKGSFTCALSGGSTPKSIYNELLKKNDALDWSKVKLYFSDERCVPLDHEESNFHMAWEAGFKHLVTREQIFPMYQEGDPRMAGEVYNSLISAVVFDLVMLGLGDDGHVASLFPFTHALQCNDRDAVANFLPNKETWRITLTFSAINRAFYKNIYVFGKKKASIVKEIFTHPYNPDQLPAQNIGSPEHKALWILDAQAAKMLGQ